MEANGEELPDLGEFEQAARNAWKAGERKDRIEASAINLMNQLVLFSESKSARDDERASILSFLDAYRRSAAGAPSPVVPALSLLSGSVWRLAEQANSASTSSDIVLAALLLAYVAGIHSQEDDS